MNTIKFKWLQDHKACKEYLNFFQRNKLEGFPVDRLGGIKGDFGGIFQWINSQVGCEREYDKNGNVIKLTDSNGRVILFEYDDHNNVIKKTYPSGGVHQFEYDQYGNIIKRNTSSGRIILYEYDKHGNMIKNINSNGNSTECEYDQRGNMVKQTYSDGDVYQWEYDERGNLTKEIYPNGDEDECVYYKYEYYDNGQLKSIHEDDLQILFIPKI